MPLLRSLSSMYVRQFENFLNLCFVLNSIFFAGTDDEESVYQLYSRFRSSNNRPDGLFNEAKVCSGPLFGGNAVASFFLEVGLRFVAQEKSIKGGLDLKAYLIMPVQRLPRYEILLKVRCLFIYTVDMLELTYP